MLHLHYANRTEPLLEALLAQIEEERTSGRSSFDPWEILVPNRHVERFLELGLARGLGIAANLRFSRIERFAREWLEARLPDRCVLDREGLEGRTLAVLLDDDVLATTELAAVRSYLLAGGSDADAIDRRRVQLALRLSRLFEEYVFSRPSMLSAWATGKTVATRRDHLANESWQRALFERLLTIPGAEGRTPILLHEALREVERSPAPSSSLPPLAAFGLSYVAPVFQWLFTALGRERELHLYTLNPCMEFWEDMPTERRRESWPRRTRWTRPTEDEPEVHPRVTESSDTPALVLWGRPGREHVHVMIDLADGAFDPCFRDPREASRSLLAHLQHDILVREPERSAPAEGMDFTHDRSLQVIAAPGIRREVETIADEIWRLLREDEARPEGTPPLRFCDIAVLVNGPEREAYVPHLESVFAEAHRIPCALVDLPLASTSRIVEAALLLLALPFSRFTRPDVLEVLTHPAVRARMPDLDPNAWVALCDRLGIFHGIDRADHDETYIERDVLHWDQGVRRLVLGAFMTNESTGDTRLAEIGDERYLPEDASDDELAFAMLARSLASDVRFARSARLPVAAWREFLVGLVEGYLTPTSSAEEGDLRKCVAAFCAIGRDLGDRAVSYRVVAELAREALEGLTGGRGEYLADGVVVSTLTPMRAIPFRVVFVVGLGEGKFPASERRDTLDLRSIRRQIGDVSPSERDEYTFLETLLNTRDRLYLSYVARDELTGDPIGPSKVIGQLLDVVRRGYAPDLAIERRPPLRRYDVDDRTGPTVFTEAHWEKRVRALGESRRNALGESADGGTFVERLTGLAEETGAAWDRLRPVLGLPPPPTSAPVKEESTTVRLSLHHLSGFLECPMQAWARTVLGIDEEGSAVESLADEPFAPDARSTTAALRTVFFEVVTGRANRDDSYRTVVERLEAHGHWPTGRLGEIRRRRDEVVLDAWLRGYEALGAPAPERIRFGPGTEFGEADRMVDAPVLEIDDPRPGYEGKLRIEIVGRTQPFVARPRGSLLLLPRALGTRPQDRVERLRQGVRAFLDHLVLSLASLVPDDAHCTHLLDAGVSPSKEAFPDGEPGEAVFVPTFAPVDAARARAYLERLATELLGRRHAYVLPCQAVFQAYLWRKDLDAPTLSRALDRVRSDGGGSSRFGPVSRPLDYASPSGDEAVELVEPRFGLYFELASRAGGGR